MKSFLTENQVLTLILAHRHQREKKLADRIKAVLMLHNGFSYTQIETALLVDEISVRRYVVKFQTAGIEGLLEMNYTGGQSRLTSAQEQQLKDYFCLRTSPTISGVVAHIAKTYGISYSIIGATKLMHRLGFVYKKPKIVPGKADREKQEQFLAVYHQVKDSLSQHDQIYFVDSTHPTHNTQLSYGWILKGKANDKYVKTNTGRERLNLNGALNFTTGTAFVLAEETVNSQATINLLETIKNRQRHGKVYLVMDNASHHHAKAVRSWLLHHPRFKPIYLPPYSPNLNLIERLWLFFHKHITANHYFETFEEFKNTTLNFFKNLTIYEKELATLLTDNFKLVPEANFQT